MTTSLFSSFGFSICALPFILLITVIYFSKKKFKGIENNVFAFLLIFTIILLSLEIVCVHTMSIRDKIPILNEVLCRGFILCCIIWVTCLAAYVISLAYRNKEVKNRKKVIIRISIFAFIIISTLFIVSCTQPLNYVGGYGNLHVIMGPAVNVIYVAGLIFGVVLILSLFTNKMDLPLYQRLPIYFVVVFFSIITSIQFALGYDFNDLAFFFAFCVVCLYFTIESQDNMLVKKLKVQKEKAEITNNAKTEFLTNMSHEIRTPMNTILGFSESLLNEKNLTEEVVKKDALSIHDASITLLDLINNILDISRIEAGKEKKEEKEYFIKDLVYEVNSVINAKINKEVLDFKIDVDKNIPSRYYGDYLKLYKIINFLIVNSIKYTNYGKINLNISGIWLEDGQYELSFVISNTGHAMKKEYFDIDFNDFIKLGKGSQNSMDSTALGLLIAKRLALLIGAELNFKNEVGHGTKYFVKIKQKVVDENVVGNIFEDFTTNSNDNKIIDCTGKKVLVVDDNKVNLELSKRLLASYNFTITLCDSGKKCLEEVKYENYDIIFLDHMMPEMDGITTLKLLKESDLTKAKVIALTANSYVGIKEKFISEGFDDYLSKPISVKELNRIINNYFKL